MLPTGIKKKKKNQTEGVILFPQHLCKKCNKLMFLPFEHQL